jgi:hypothetical protein
LSLSVSVPRLALAVDEAEVAAGYAQHAAGVIPVAAGSDEVERDGEQADVGPGEAAADRLADIGSQVLDRECRGRVARA